MSRARRVDPAELMAPSDVADMLGVRPSAVGNWAARGLGFPAPVARIGRGRTAVYLRAEVRAWAAARADVIGERADRAEAAALRVRRREERARAVLRGAR